MLRESENVRQHEDEARRRWFVDAYFDLIVWYEPEEQDGQEESDRILGFQLCYDKAHDEHALTWRRVGGFTHHAIDDGQSDPMANRSPILMPDGVVPVDDLRRRFSEACGDMDPIIARLVLQRLDELAG
jgi:hypothetical protein